MASRDKKQVYGKEEDMKTTFSSIALAKEVTDMQSLMAALSKAYDSGVRDMERACIARSRKMCALKLNEHYQRTYHRATGTRAISECANKLITERW